MTTVVNITRCPNFDAKSNPNDVYIGRYHPGRPFFPGSRWRNTYREDSPSLKRDGARDEVIEKYRQRLLGRPDLLAHLPELKGKRLGCWCKPKRCHGDLLADWADHGIPPH
jgi:hypothetical protein